MSIACNNFRIVHNIKLVKMTDKSCVRGVFGYVGSIKTSLEGYVSGA